MCLWNSSSLFSGHAAALHSSPSSTNKNVAPVPTVMTTKGGVKLQSAPDSFSFQLFFFSSWRVWPCLSGPALPAHKAICSHQSFGAASHMLASPQGVSHSRISRSSSTSQVFSTWCEQVRAWLCQPMMKFGSWNTKFKFGLRSESGTRLHPMLWAKSNCSTSWNPNTTVLWVA